MLIVRATFLLEILCLVASTAAGQTVVKIQAGPGGQTNARVDYQVPPPPFTVIAGAPYSAEQIQEHWHTASDGKLVSPPPRSTKMWRDSTGRTRTEGPLFGLNNSPSIIEINDPVAGRWYLLDPETNVAHRAALESRLEQPASGTRAAGSTGLPGTAQSRQCSRDSLGSKTIEGVLAEGWLIQCTEPTRGDAAVAELWTAAMGLKVTVLRKTSFLQGESTLRLINISRAEPDPSLFQPPPEYKVVDETSRFTVARK